MAFSQIVRGSGGSSLRSVQRLVRPQRVAATHRGSPIASHRNTGPVSMLASCHPFSSKSTFPFNSLLPAALSWSSGSKTEASAELAVPATLDAPSAEQTVSAPLKSSTTQLSEAATAVRDNDSVSTLVEQAGKTFSEITLSWWPNVRVVEVLMNSIQEMIGLPWWATIMSVTACIRMILLPIIAKGQAHSQRVANIQPELQALMKEMLAAQKAGDQYELQQAKAKVQKFIKDKDAHPLGAFKMVLIQMPIFVSFFFGLRALAEQNLLSMKTGGILWFPDLTMADGTMALPILSALSTLGVMETGAELGATSKPSQQQKTMRWAVRGGVCIMPFMVAKLPAVCFVYWITASVFSLGQLFFLQISAVKKYFNIPERIDRRKSATTTSDSSSGSQMTFAEAVSTGYSSQRPINTFVTPGPSVPAAPSKQEQAFNKWFKKSRSAAIRGVGAPSSTEAASVTFTKNSGSSDSASLEGGSGSNSGSGNALSIPVMQRDMERQREEAEVKRLRIAAARSRRNQRKRY